MSDTCSYCGEEGHSIQQCPQWKSKEVTSQNVVQWHGTEYYAYGSAARPLDWLTIKGAITTVVHPALVRLSRTVDYGGEVPYFNILLSPTPLTEKEVKALELESISKEDMHRWRITRSAEVATATAPNEFQEPLLGRCTYQFFYITNNLYGGYSAKCEKGSISVDYADPRKVVDMAEKAEMFVNLAGEAWKEVGKHGFGEIVYASEARDLLKKLAEKRGFTIRGEHSSTPKRVYVSPAGLMSSSSPEKTLKKFVVIIDRGLPRETTVDVLAVSEGEANWKARQEFLAKHNVLPQTMEIHEWLK